MIGLGSDKNKSKDIGCPNGSFLYSGDPSNRAKKLEIPCEKIGSTQIWRLSPVWGKCAHV